MTTAGRSEARAFDATVVTSGGDDDPHAAYVRQVEAEVSAIEEKMAGWKVALAEKKDELKRARAAARKGA